MVSRLTLATCLVVALLGSLCSAFVQSPAFVLSPRPHVTSRSTPLVRLLSSPTPPLDDDASRLPPPDESVSSSSLPPSAPPPLDPAIEFLKRQVSEASLAVKDATAELKRLQTETTDKYSFSGYARLAAEVENYRKSRASLESSFASSTLSDLAFSLAALWPSVGKSKSTSGKSDDNLVGAAKPLRAALEGLGLEAIEPPAGSTFDPSRHEPAGYETQAEQGLWGKVLCVETLGWRVAATNDVVLKARCTVGKAPELLLQEQPVDEEKKDFEPAVDPPAST